MSTSPLVPHTDHWDWQLEGLCRGSDSGLFYAPDDERPTVRRQRETAAVAVCKACPVLEACRKQALETREPYGVWGGLTEVERRRMLAKKAG